MCIKSKIIFIVLTIYIFKIMGRGSSFLINFCKRMGKLLGNAAYMEVF